MCELCPQWVHEKNLSRKSNDFRGAGYSPRFEEEVGKTIDDFDICSHTSVSRLTNGNFYCYQCQKELKLSLALTWPVVSKDVWTIPSGLTGASVGKKNSYVQNIIGIKRDIIRKEVDSDQLKSKLNDYVKI